MSEKNTGGPAFPGAVDITAPPGMTLRDYFAGQALVEYAGLMSVSKPETMNVVAKLSYQMADAMIEARDK